MRFAARAAAASSQRHAVIGHLFNAAGDNLVITKYKMRVKELSKKSGTTPACKKTSGSAPVTPLPATEDRTKKPSDIENGGVLDAPPLPSDAADSAAVAADTASLPGMPEVWGGMLESLRKSMTEAYSAVENEKKRRKTASDAADDARTETDRCRAELAETRKELTVALDDAAKAREETDHCRAEVAEIRKALTAARDDVAKAHKELDTARTSAESMAAELATARRAAEDAAAELDTAQRAAGDATVRLNAAQQTIEEMAQQRVEADNEADAGDAAAARATEENDALRGQLAAAHGRISATESAAADTAAECATLRRRLDDTGAALSAAAMKTDEERRAVADWVANLSGLLDAAAGRLPRTDVVVIGPSSDSGEPGTPREDDGSAADDGSSPPVHDGSIALGRVFAALKARVTGIAAMIDASNERSNRAKAAMETRVAELTAQLAARIKHEKKPRPAKRSRTRAKTSKSKSLRQSKPADESAASVVEQLATDGTTGSALVTGFATTVEQLADAALAGRPVGGADVAATHAAEISSFAARLRAAIDARESASSRARQAAANAEFYRRELDDAKERAERAERAVEEAERCHAEDTRVIASLRERLCQEGVAAQTAAAGDTDTPVASASASAVAPVVAAVAPTVADTDNAADNAARNAAICANAATQARALALYWKQRAHEQHAVAEHAKQRAAQEQTKYARLFDEVRRREMHAEQAKSRIDDLLADVAAVMCTTVARRDAAPSPTVLPAQENGEHPVRTAANTFGEEEDTDAAAAAAAVVLPDAPEQLLAASPLDAVDRPLALAGPSLGELASAFDNSVAAGLSGSTFDAPLTFDTIIRGGGEPDDAHTVGMALVGWGA